MSEWDGEREYIFFAGFSILGKLMEWKCDSSGWDEHSKVENSKKIRRSQREKPAWRRWDEWKTIYSKFSKAELLSGVGFSEPRWKTKENYADKGEKNVKRERIVSCLGADLEKQKKKFANISLPQKEILGGGRQRINSLRRNLWKDFAPLRKKNLQHTAKYRQNQVEKWNIFQLSIQEFRYSHIYFRYMLTNVADYAEEWDDATHLPSLSNPFICWTIFSSSFFIFLMFNSTHIYRVYVREEKSVKKKIIGSH